MQQTTKLKLNLPDQTDYVEVDVLDDNFKKIDTFASTTSTEINALKKKDNIFVAKYESTTYAEIVAQRDLGKHILLTGQLPKDGGVIQAINASLVYVDSTKAVFSQAVSKPDYRIREYSCTAPNTWATEFSRTQSTSNKTNSITSSSTTTQYPSAKAVYDALDAKVFERTVKTANTWSKDTNNVYYQNITVKDVKTTDKIIIDVDMSQATQKVAGQTLLDNYALIGRAYVLSNNTIKLCCYDATPTAVVALKVLVIR